MTAENARAGARRCFVCDALATRPDVVAYSREYSNGYYERNAFKVCARLRRDYALDRIAATGPPFVAGLAANFRWILKATGKRGRRLAREFLAEG